MDHDPSKKSLRKLNSNTVKRLKKLKFKNYDNNHKELFFEVFERLVSLKHKRRSRWVRRLTKTLDKRAKRLIASHEDQLENDYDLIKERIIAEYRPPTYAEEKLTELQRMDFKMDEETNFEDFVSKYRKLVTEAYPTFTLEGRNKILLKGLKNALGPQIVSTLDDSLTETLDEFVKVANHYISNHWTPNDKRPDKINKERNAEPAVGQTKISQVLEPTNDDSQITTKDCENLSIENSKRQTINDSNDNRGEKSYFIKCLENLNFTNYRDDQKELFFEEFERLASTKRRVRWLDWLMKKLDKRAKRVISSQVDNLQYDYDNIKERIITEFRGPSGSEQKLAELEMMNFEINYEKSFSVFVVKYRKCVSESFPNVTEEIRNKVTLTGLKNCLDPAILLSTNKQLPETLNEFVDEVNRCLAISAETKLNESIIHIVDQINRKIQGLETEDESDTTPFAESEINELQSRPDQARSNDADIQCINKSAQLAEKPRDSTIFLKDGYIRIITDDTRKTENPQCTTTSSQNAIFVQHETHIPMDGPLSLSDTSGSQCSKQSTPKNGTILRSRFDSGIQHDNSPNGYSMPPVVFLNSVDSGGGDRSTSANSSAKSTPSLDVVGIPISSNTNSTSLSTLGKTYHCQRCLNHGTEIPRKGHKRFCEYANCECLKCSLVEERKMLNREINSEREKNISPINVDKSDDAKLRTRNPKCARCGVHVKDVEPPPLKGHKKICPYQSCTCRKCKLVTRRRSIMAKQIHLRRTQKAKQFNSIIGDKDGRTSEASTPKTASASTSAVGTTQMLVELPTPPGLTSNLCSSSSLTVRPNPTYLGLNCCSSALINSIHHQHNLQQQQQQNSLSQLITLNQQQQQLAAGALPSLYHSHQHHHRATLPRSLAEAFYSSPVGSNVASPAAASLMFSPSVVASSLLSEFLLQSVMPHHGSMVSFNGMPVLPLSRNDLVSAALERMVGPQPQPPHWTNQHAFSSSLPSSGLRMPLFPNVSSPEEMQI